MADDGWELLAGLAMVLPLTLLASRQSGLLAAAVLLGGVLATLSLSLARKLG